MSNKSWIADSMQKRFETADLDDYVSACIGKMEKSGTKAVVVVDGDSGSYAGVVTDRAIARSLIDPAKTKVRAVLQRVPPLRDGAGVADAAKTMIDLGVTVLPVVEGQKPVGVVPESTVLEKVAVSPLGRSKLSEVMTKPVITIQKNGSIGQAVSLMRQYGVTRLPVVDGPRLLGMVTLRDVLDKVVRPKLRVERGWGAGKNTSLLREPVASIMSTPAVALSPEDTVSKALEVMNQRRISSVLVQNELGELVGIVTKHDTMRPLSKYVEKDTGLQVQVSAKTPGGTREFDMKSLQTALAGLGRKFGKSLAGSVLSVYLKEHKEQKQGRRLMHVRLVLSGPAGNYASAGEGWGDDQALRAAMNGLERQLAKKKAEMKNFEEGHKSLYDAFSIFY